MPGSLLGHFVVRRKLTEHCKSTIIVKNFFFFCYFRAVPVAYRGSQARGQIGAVAAGLPHSHSNAGPQPRLRAAPQLMANAASLTH